MKLLVAVSAPPDGGGGISAYARILARSLSAAGHEVHYASPAPRDQAFLNEHGLVPVTTDPDGDPHLNAERLLRHVRDHAIEGCVNNDNPVLQSIAPALPAPLVAVCHMDRRIVASLCTLHADWVDHLVCISSDMIGTMVRRYGFPTTRCRLVYNGAVDPGHSGSFEPQNAGTLRLISAAGWNRNKGGPRLLDAMLSNREVWGRVELDWFGVVPERIQRKVAHLPGIRFRGQAKQAVFHQALADADALLFPSGQEGCPMTMLEAMSYGVLPIATDGVGAMRWLIDSGREGFICSLRDWKGQATECVAYLSARPQVVGEMKRAARERYLRDFQASTNAERVLALVCQPTIDRRQPATRFEVVRWHRPFARRLSWIERLRYRTGWLDRAGYFETGSLTS